MSHRPVILLAFANDHGPEGRFLSELSREMAELAEILDEKFDYKLKPSASKHKITTAFQRHRERIKVFHYGGHANSDGIQTEEKSEDSPPITFARGLAEFIGMQKGVRLAFLNGCDTDEQAKEFIKSNIPCVITTNISISDRVARQFSAEFYKSFNEGRNIQEAFDEAKAAIRMSYKSDREMTENEVNNERQLKFRNKKEEKREDFPYTLHIDKRFPEAALETIAKWTLPEPIKSDVIPESTPIGNKVYLLCNRERHNHDFEDQVQVILGQEKRKPQFFFLHGPHEERPNSLANRFFEFTVKDILGRLKEKISPGKCYRYQINFPTLDDFNSRTKNKAWLRLKNHFNDQGLDLPETGIDVLRRIGNQRRVVLIQHNVMAHEWHPGMVSFIEKYFREFWDLDLKPNQPQIVVVINLTYHLTKGFSGLLKRGKDRNIENALINMSENIDNCFMIERLDQVPSDDVAKWQNRYLPDKPQLIEEIFGRKNKLPMNKIEDKLIQYINDNR